MSQLVAWFDGCSNNLMPFFRVHGVAHTSSLFVYLLNRLICLIKLHFIVNAGHTVSIRIINITIIMLFRGNHAATATAGAVAASLIHYIFIMFYSVVFLWVIQLHAHTHTHIGSFFLISIVNSLSFSPFHSQYLHSTIALFPPFYTLARSTTINQITIDVCMCECTHYSMYYIKL